MLKRIQNSWYRLMAKQLRHPSGILAKLTGNKMNTSNESLYQLVLSNLNVEDGDHLLEIGFGNGKFFPELYAKAKDLQITGIDLSHEMVTQAVKNNTELFENGSLKVKVANSENLPFEDKSFDKIFCINVIYFWEIPEQHLKEIYRVLKPGGKFYTGFRPVEAMLQLPFTKYGFTLVSEEEWYKKLSDNHFTDISSAKLKGPTVKQVGLKMELDEICMTAKK
ncbi:MAG: methyltransferase domain-containing protein [Chitinophagaceae bacterium]|nr:methyltransferase domain-containing protein [Chitinophagaceae bacterium]